MVIIITIIIVLSIHRQIQEPCNKIIMVIIITIIIV